MALRKYQEEIINESRDLFQTHKRILINLPTGGGKSHIIGKIAKSIQDNKNKAWIISHRYEIHNQLVNHCLNSKVQPGQILSGRRMTSNNIQVGMIQTIHRKLKYLAPVLPNIIIVDEAHHVVSDTYMDVVNYNPDMKVLGFTATPSRTDGRGMNEAGFSAMIKGPQTYDLIRAGFLTMPVILSGESTKIFLNKKFKIKNGEIDKDDQTKFSSEKLIVQDTIKSYKKYFNGDPCIIFCCSVEDSKMVAAEMRSRGWKCEAVNDDLDYDLRKKYIDGLSTGEINCITNYNLISEGVDIPVLSGIIMRRKTASLIIWLQACGRALRKNPGKTKAIIIDQAGNIFQHGHVLDYREWTLEGIVKKDKEDGLKIKQCHFCGCWVQSSTEYCPGCGESLKRDDKPYEPDKIKIIDKPLVEIKPNNLNIDSSIIDETEIMECDPEEIEAMIIEKIKNKNYNTRERLEILGSYFGKSRKWMDQVWNQYYLKNI